MAGSGVSDGCQSWVADQLLAIGVGGAVRSVEQVPSHAPLFYRLQGEFCESLAGRGVRRIRFPMTGLPAAIAAAKSPPATLLNANGSC